MSRPALFIVLTCSQCGAESGEPCVKRDGTPTARPHLGRTPKAPCGSYGAYQQHVKRRSTGSANPQRGCPAPRGKASRRV